MERIGVLIVDDHPVVREGLRKFLLLREEIEVVGEAADGETAVALVEELLPDVVLMDLVLPSMDGIEATRRIREVSPSTKVVVLTSFADDDKVVPAIKAGAAGYLLKDVEPTAIIDAVHKAHAGEALLHPTIVAKLIEEVARDERRPARPSLTARELEVLSQLATGKSNREIASGLSVSTKTVKTHISNILAKLHLSDRTQAALYAVRRGLASTED